MRKICLISLVLVSSFALRFAYAATFSLDKIGNLSTEGKNYTEWWYTVANPVLSGKAAENADVKVKIDDKESTVKSNSSGDWSYSPTTLKEGDRKIAITASNGSYSFTLHVGQNLPANLGGTGSTSTTQSTKAVPTTGSTQLIAILLSMSLFGLGYYYYNRKPLKDFEKSALKGL